MAGTLLVSRKNEVEIGAVKDRIEDGENGTTRVTDCEDMLDSRP
jgi:hypothetical protein